LPWHFFFFRLPAEVLITGSHDILQGSLVTLEGLALSIDPKPLGERPVTGDFGVTGRQKYDRNVVKHG